MQISARGDYAVRAALSLATAYPALLSTQAIAAEQDMPRKFLEAVLADLRRAGIVRAQRGAEGGYALARPPRDVTIGQILRAVDALQLTDSGPFSTPADWREGQKVIVAPTVSTADARERFGDDAVDEVLPYLRFTTAPA